MKKIQVYKQCKQKLSTYWAIMEDIPKYQRSESTQVIVTDQTAATVEISEQNKT